MAAPSASECARCKGPTREDLPIFLAVGKRVYAFCSSKCVERYARKFITDKPLCACKVYPIDVGGKCRSCYNKAWRAAQGEDSRYRRYVTKRIREKAMA